MSILLAHIAAFGEHLTSLMQKLYPAASPTGKGGFFKFVSISYMPFVDAFHSGCVANTDRDGKKSPLKTTSYAIDENGNKVATVDVDPQLIVSANPYLWCQNGRPQLFIHLKPGAYNHRFRRAGWIGTSESKNPSSSVSPTLAFQFIFYNACIQCSTYIVKYVAPNFHFILHAYLGTSETSERDWCPISFSGGDLNHFQRHKHVLS